MADNCKIACGICTARPDATSYMKGSNQGKACTKGIATKAECETAAAALKLSQGSSALESDTAVFPTGCYTFESGLYFNSRASTGTGMFDTYPICEFAATKGKSDTICATGTVIESKDDCKTAAKYVDATFTGQVTEESISSAPSGCYDFFGSAYFNTHKSGSASSMASPLCLDI
mmetsp:Transcript_67995/g.186366  ORF Transcript_67995/g.186366 Transcript_67995/m.186366 type:complete len:175 (-) Transcript_67995:68-592(-)